MANHFATELALRAAARTASGIRWDLRRDAHRVAFVSGSLALLGLWLSVNWLMFHTFLGVTGDRSTILFGLIERLGNSLWPVALGLAMSVQASWLRRTLLSESEQATAEMAVMQADLLTAILRSCHTKRSPADN